jgi:hypothetical protein
MANPEQITTSLSNHIATWARINKMLHGSFLDNVDVAALIIRKAFEVEETDTVIVEGVPRD